MKYENLKKFILSTKASKSTIYRFYKKNEDLFAETDFKNGKRMFPADHARYFDSEMEPVTLDLLFFRQMI
ncbi:hypothetical protein [Flavobacterium sp. N502540]|uniref:hypothetical protein n=1 Tax=Flavobacterium sp. N502540 TaxID=2986838 RepID=UPI002224B533|nr:hypothetical protein [Flavobacterium sp. N502540]